VLEILDGSGIPAPRLVDYSEVEKESGREIWLVMTQLPGRSLRDELLYADPPRRWELLRDTGQLLKRLHTTEVPDILKRERPWIDGKLAQAAKNLAWCDGTAALLADLHRRRPAAVPEVFIHGDFAPDNVLVDAATGMSLIDWSDGGPGDPRHDIALVLRADRQFSAAEATAFFDGYSLFVDRTTCGWFEELDEFF
jgi:aminoglycoside phosphotransferase (APT) family kinase protein